VKGAVLALDGLVAGREVDDAEPRVAEADAAVLGHPHALGVGPPVPRRESESGQPTGVEAETMDAKGMGPAAARVKAWGGS
jgi:hypothetical protein